MAGKGNLANLRPFPKGTSGNPGGRSKGIKALLEDLEGPSIEVLAKRLTERQDLAAACYVLDQIHGKSTQRIESSVQVDWPTQAARILVILQKHTFTHDALQELKTVLLSQAELPAPASEIVVEGKVVEESAPQADSSSGAGSGDGGWVPVDGGVGEK